MRSNIYMRLFFSCTIISLAAFLYLSLKDSKNGRDVVIGARIRGTDEDIGRIEKAAEYQGKDQASNDIGRIEKLADNMGQASKVPSKDLKYILRWTSSKNVPFVYMGEGRSGFLDRRCPYTNCYVTGDRNHLGDYTKFDVIAFAGPEVSRMSKAHLPERRSVHQKYVFATIESADNYPVCSDKFDGVFNWTWTYKLDSEAKWGYIVVRDSNNQLIGPKTIMHWMKLEEMKPASEDLKTKLRQKTKAAAWFVSNCYSRSARESFVRDLQSQLKRYGLKVDVYGKCGTFKCEREKDEECFKLIEKDYYFYLSFENSFSEDYVTEKLLHGLKNYAVPIVYGGANYTRFMPDGIYLNARELGVEKLAEKMNELIQNPDEYADYFRWRNHYSYYRRFESLETDDYCSFCTILNNEELVKRTSVYQNFRRWWDPPNRC